MKQLLIACGLVLLSVSLSAQDPQAEKQAVQAVLDKMAAATKAKDLGALGALYHDALLFHHSSGLIQSKDDVIKALAATKRVTESFTFDSPTIVVMGATALVRNGTHIRYVGEATPIDLDTLWVLVKGTQGWQIASRHANRPAAPTKGQE